MTKNQKRASKENFCHKRLKAIKKLADSMISDGDGSYRFPTNAIDRELFVIANNAHRAIFKIKTIQTKRKIEGGSNE